MKKVKKIIRIFTYFLFIVFFSFPFYSCNKQIIENDEYNLYIYMSGGDLESNTGSASKVITQLCNYENPKNISVYILAGGTEKWNNDEMDPTSVSLYEIKGKKLNKLEDYGKANMGDISTFQKFIEYTNSEKKAKKVLMFWGHGSPYGICSDGNYGDNALTYKEINKGLENSHFDLMIFNTCYSANIDLLAYVADYTNYVIASENVFPSLGYDYPSMLKAFDYNEKKDVKDIAKNIIVDCKNKYKKSSIIDSLTLSLIDTNKLKESIGEISYYFEGIFLNVNNWFKSAAITKKVSEKAIDFADIDDHYDYSSKVSDLINNFVEYEIHGKSLDTNGVYLYYKDKIDKIDLSMYQENCWFEAYYYLLSSKKAVENGDYISFENSFKDDNYIANCILSDTASIYSGLFSYSIYNGDDEICEDILGIDFYIDKASYNYHLYVEKEANFQLKLFNQTLSYYYYTIGENDTQRSNVYAVAIEYNGMNGKMLFSYNYDKEDKYNGTYEIIGFIEKCDEDEGHFIYEIINGGIITINGIDYTYNGEEIIRDYPLNQLNIKINVYDIFGNIYTYDK